MFNLKRYFLIFYLFIFPNVFINYGYIIVTRFFGILSYFKSLFKE